jgi:hypothetical protein
MPERLNQAIGGGVSGGLARVKSGALIGGRTRDGITRKAGSATVWGTKATLLHRRLQTSLQSLAPES